jgi:methylmalonyl-CoA mutase N-terminal domain/subunit
MDEALALPSEKSVMIALRTQQIIANESGVTNTVDPLAGSYAIESLTDEIEKKAFEYIQQIDEMGGMLVAIEKGYVQKHIQDSAYEYQRSVESKQAVVVGVNQYKIEESNKDMKLLSVDASVGERQIKKLADLRRSRDNIAVNNALDAIQAAAADESRNLMPLIIDAVRAYATEGEICGVLRRVFGEYTENIVL